jgi:hypothetical protein
MPRHQGGEEYTLVLRALKSEAPPVIRLKRVLKALLRAYDFRCTSCRDVTPKLPPLPPTASPAALGPPSGQDEPSPAERPS